MAMHEPLKLSSKCQNCDNNEYSTDDNGYFVCTECGIINKKLQLLELDYNDANQKGKNKIKGKSEIEHCDIKIDNEDLELSCRNSTHYKDNDCESRLSDGKSQVSFNEVFREHQEIFLKLLKTLYILYKKTDYLNSINSWHSSNLSQGSCSTFQTSFFANSQNNFNEDSNNFLVSQNFYKVAEIFWFNFVYDEYNTQVVNNNPLKKKHRSRRNTEEEEHKKIKNEKQELISRRIKKKNINEIEDFKKSHISRREKTIKFMEEYEKVKLNCDLEEFNYSNLSKYTGKDNIKFEEMIHQVFIEKNLDYSRIYKENNYNFSKSSFCSDSYLSLFFNILIATKHDFTMKDFNSLFRNFNLIETGEFFSRKEIEFLKYRNKEKYLNLSQKIQNKYNLRLDSKKILSKICNSIGMNSSFNEICYKIYQKIEKKIILNITPIYHEEAMLVAIVFFAMKLIYGLNDLPYLFNLRDINFNHLESDIMKKIEESLRLMELYGLKDSVYSTIKEFPTFREVLKNMNLIINDEKENLALWSSDDFKSNYNLKYKEKYLNFSNKIWFSEKHNNYIHNHVEEFLKSGIKTVPIKCEKPVKMNLKFSKKFLEKNEKHYEFKESNLNRFLVEEIEFHTELSRSNKRDKIKKLQIPLPCDNIVTFKRHAMKFEGISPPESELVLYYFFRAIFKIDSNVIRKCSESVEKFLKESI